LQTERLQGLAVQKEFALEAVKCAWSSALFSLRKGENMLRVVTRTSAAKQLELPAPA
jgi:hypothetical protein